MGEKRRILLSDAEPIAIILLAFLIVPISLCLLLFSVLVLQLNPLIFVAFVGAAFIVLLILSTKLREFYEKTGFKNLLIVSIIWIVAGCIIVPYAYWDSTRARWSLQVSLDKAFYKVGENITMTATLTNAGSEAQSLVSVGVPTHIVFEVKVEGFQNYLCPGSIADLGNDTFTLDVGQSIQRVFVWNQVVEFWDLRNFWRIPASMNKTGSFQVNVEVKDIRDIALFGTSTTLQIEE